MEILIWQTGGAEVLALYFYAYIFLLQLLMCLATLDEKCKCPFCVSICSLIMVHTLIFVLLQLPLVPVLDVGKQNRRTVLESILVWVFFCDIFL